MPRAGSGSKERQFISEREVPAHIAQELADRGHKIVILNDNDCMGKGEIIWRMENGVLCGGAEPRADGTVAAW